MSWQDRPWRDDSEDRSRGLGGDWGGMRPTLDNPLSWSVPIGRYFGIDVRLHVIFPVFVVIMLLISAGAPDRGDAAPVGMAVMAGLLACLFIVVLVHEFGHCFACRSTGGRADEILMWPLGGLAYCHPPQRWTAHFITVAGGPVVNVAICLVLIPLLGLATGRWLGVAVPNPVSPFGGLYAAEVSGSPVLSGLYLLNYVSFVLLLLNLLPMYPMDGGRLMQSILWSKYGYVRSMRFTIRAGYIAALLLGIAAFPLGSVMLFAIAVFGGVTCYHTYRQLQFTEETLGFEADEFAFTPAGSPEVKEADRAGPTLAERRAERAARREAEEAEEADRILQKIHDHGMDSLTGRERRLLQRVTDRKKRS